MKFRAPLANVRGLGSAKEGTQHFYAQRLTAIALVPLSLWFVFRLLSVVGADYETALARLGSPLDTLLLVAFLVATFHHAQLGLQVVIEDYVHTRWLKLAGLVSLKLAAVLLGAASVLAALRISFGG